jgi:hypothetical protein
MLTRRSCPPARRPQLGQGVHVNMYHTKAGGCRRCRPATGCRPTPAARNAALPLRPTPSARTPSIPAGYRRSGDLHDCTQFDVVLRGRTRLRLIVSGPCRPGLLCILQPLLGSTAPGDAGSECLAGDA